MSKRQALDSGAHLQVLGPQRACCPERKDSPHLPAAPPPSHSSQRLSFLISKMGIITESTSLGATKMKRRNIVCKVVSTSLAHRRLSEWELLPLLLFLFQCPGPHTDTTPLSQPVAPRLLMEVCPGACTETLCLKPAHPTPGYPA